MKSEQKLVILITGGRRGIGKSIAKELSNRGAVVYTTSRSGPAIFDNRHLKLDVRDEISVIKCFDDIIKSELKIDVLINNAGIGFFKPIEEISLIEWKKMVDTNLTGTFLCCREAFKKMSGGRIINIGSIADELPLVENSGYGATKCGVRGLSNILNEEGKSRQIHLTHVTLGAVFTEIWADRKGPFSPDDMLNLETVAKTIAEVAVLPLGTRIDQITLLPPKGAL